MYKGKEGLGGGDLKMYNGIKRVRRRGFKFF